LGVNMNGGLVRDCIIQDNNQQTGWNHVPGGGVYVTGGGTVSNCVIRRNMSYAGTALGGGVYVDNGLITHCQVLNNTNNASFASSGGGGVYVNGASAILRNCLVAGNYGQSIQALGGGVHIGASGGEVQNCTIATNGVASGSDGGGVYRLAGTVSNSIVYFNYVGATHSNLNTTAGLAYSCSTNPALSGNGNISADPLFASVASNFTLQASSPCIDKGTNQTWMIGALDLAGNSRKQWGKMFGSKADPIVDMGAYEFPEPPPAGTMFLLR